MSRRPPSARRAVVRGVAIAGALLLALAPARVAGQPALDSLVPPSPAPRGFVHDGGPVLDGAARARLDARIAAIQRETGGDIGVAILRDLRGRAPQEVSVAIYRAWKIGRVDSLGSARRDLGALLLIVPKELAPDGRGECFILTGLGAEGELLDPDAGRICRDAVIPRLRERDYEGAVAAGVDSIGAELRRAVAGEVAPGAVGAAARGGDDDGDGRTVGLVLLGLGGGGVGLAGLVAFLRHRRRVAPRPCPRGHGLMVRLGEAEDDARLSPGQRAEERVGSVDYDVWSCPADGCDEFLVIPYGRWSGYRACPRCGFKTVARTTRTLVPATQVSTGVQEITLACANCDWRDVRRGTLPRLPAPGTSSGGGGGGGGGGFGGSGRTAGGGGGASY
ncbi:MAG TPA: TPM domain-containing protein [Gemmatimonadaceae bacterium]|nr:TPM domain-containing protein [Gemmatimonadaceae bacterium]